MVPCAPPFAARMQLVALVGHPEGNLFAGLALVGLLVLFRETSPGRRRLGAVLLGGSMTLGGTFAYSVLPAAGLCLLLPLRNHDRLRGLWRPLLISMALGSLPWLAYFIGRVDLAQAWSDSGGAGILALFLGTPAGSEIYSQVPLGTRIADLVQHHLFWMWGWMAQDESFRSPTNYPLGAVVFAAGLLGVVRFWGNRFVRSAGRIPSTAPAPTATLVVGFAVLYILCYLSILSLTNYF